MLEEEIHLRNMAAMRLGEQILADPGVEYVRGGYSREIIVAVRATPKVEIPEEFEGYRVRTVLPCSPRRRPQ